MANVVLKTEEAQAARITPLPPAPVSVEAVESSAAAAVAAPASSSSRRYNQATIEKALAVAMRMQQEHQSTLSTEQAVRLGEEINVDRAFMLKALAQIDGVTEASAATRTTIAPQSSQSQKSELRLIVSQLPLFSRYIAVTVPLLFAIVSYFVFIAPDTQLDSSHNNFSIIWMFVGGPLVALLLGTGLRKVRLERLGWFCTGLFIWLVGMLATRAEHPMPVGDFFDLLFYFTAAGLTLGLMGAAIPRLYKRAMAALLRQFPHLAEGAR